jgi:hypothetical protein
MTDVIESDVELSLDATGQVVRSATVAQDDDAPRRAQPDLCRTPRSAARTRSASTNGMTGQSFQSRSSA